jgi:hypothetical protein
VGGLAGSATPGSQPVTESPSEDPWCTPNLPPAVDDDAREDADTATDEESVDASGANRHGEAQRKSCEGNDSASVHARTSGEGT